MRTRRATKIGQYPVPNHREMRTPIVVYKTQREPDDTFRFDLKLDEVYQGWAKRIDGGGRATANGDTIDATHVFICRRQHNGWSPQTDWFIISKGRVYRILDHKEMDQDQWYWVIRAFDEGATSEYDFDDVDTPENPHDPDNPQPEPDPQYPGMPGWS